MSIHQPDWIINNPGNECKITTLYAVISIDKNGNEGIFAINNMPCIFGTPRVFDKLLPVVKEAAKSQGMKIKVSKFDLRGEG